MERKYKTFDDVVRVWKFPPSCPAPVFPALHFEIVKAEECRGALILEDLIADIDFVGYPLGAHDILIDSLGRVFDLKFDEIVYPNEIIATWSESEIKECIMPSLKFAGNEQLTNEIMNEKDVTAIVEKMATYFAW